MKLNGIYSTVGNLFFYVSVHVCRWIDIKISLKYLYGSKTLPWCDYQIFIQLRKVLLFYSFALTFMAFVLVYLLGILNFSRNAFGDSFRTPAPCKQLTQFYICLYLLSSTYFVFSLNVFPFLSILYVFLEIFSSLSST